MRGESNGTSIRLTKDVADLLRQVRVEIFQWLAEERQRSLGQPLILEEPSLNRVVEALCHHFRATMKTKRKRGGP